MTSNMPHLGRTGPGSNRLLSQPIFGKFPLKSYMVGTADGRFYFDDFLNHPAHISDQKIGNYATYIDSGVTLKQSASEHVGALEVAGNDADNDEGIVQSGGAAGGLVKIDVDAEKRVAFECRIKKASIADNGLAFFVGLSEEGLTDVETLVDNTGALASKDFIGFRTLHDAGEEIDFVSRKAGQATQEKANIHTMVADTYVKLGFLFDRKAPSGDRLRIFVNGIEEADRLTQANLDAATFPDDEELCLLLATKVGTAAEVKLQLDWWAVAAED